MKTLAPLHQTIGAEIMPSVLLHAGDTPVRGSNAAPGGKQGRI